MLFRYFKEHGIIFNHQEKKILLNPEGISKLSLIGKTKIKDMAKNELKSQGRCITYFNIIYFGD